MPEAPDHREDEDCPSAEVCGHGCDQHPKPVELTEAERELLGVDGMFPTQFGWEHPEKWEKSTVRDIGAKVGRIVAARVARIVSQGYVTAAEAAAREAAARREALLEAGDHFRRFDEVVARVEALAAKPYYAQGLVGGKVAETNETPLVFVSDLRKALAEPERDEEPEEIHHCDGCGEDYNILAESHIGHRPERDEESGR